MYEQLRGDLTPGPVRARVLYAVASIGKLAHRLREIRPGLPILLATGYSNAAVNVRGDFPILRKPYEIHQLSEAIAKLPR